ncbi:MAG: DUF1080 domain-containing protein [Verrucomicrobiota bacterium]
MIPKKLLPLLLATVVACMGTILLIAQPAGAEKAEETSQSQTAEGRPPSISLFDGNTMGKWQSVAFGGEGDVHVAFDGSLTLENGTPLTGVVWTGDKRELPTSNYEISLEAKKHYGDDFFCGLTLPVGDNFATFICGGWGGVVVGLSSINGKDASLNETSTTMTFENNRWYRLRVRVTDDRITSWIDDKKVFEVPLAEKKISLRSGPIDRCAPLGIANFLTRSAFRNIDLRHLDPLPSKDQP